MLNLDIQTAMLGKDAILHFFIAKGIRHLFYLPGIHSLPLSESFRRHKIQVIMGRHELDLAYMTIGYAEASGGPGVLIVTPGPGLGNIISGCMEAHAGNVPLLILHVDTGREEIGKGILHELAAVEALFRPITKAVFAASRKEEVVPVLREGFRTMITGRRGTVLVSIPYRFFEKDISAENEEHEEREVSPELDGAMEVLEGCHKPVIIGGKSLMREDLGMAVKAICEEKGIPFLTTTSGKGAISELSRCAFGNVMAKGLAREIVSSADMVIALGTRLRDMDVKRRGVKIHKLVHIDVDDAWIGRNHGAHLGASGDLGTALGGIRKILKNSRFDWDMDLLKEKERRERETLKKGSTGFRVMQIIRDAVPPETTTVWDLSLVGYWAEYYFPVVHQRTFIMPTGVAPTFFSFPAALGAKLSRTDQPVLSVTGDGSFLPCASDLATAKQYNIPVVILVYNSGGFGILEEYMDSSYGIRSSMALANPDFTKLAKSFGIKAKKAGTLDRLKGLFRDDVTWDEPFLIELDLPAFPPPWKFIF
ncbi:MAG: thiamine pyrophosphate-binding protein [Syntrophobacterales bacterium]|jgi:acetolactate synthase-1/2/3 large subunit|nr:thiamine pyrophosphate-binding protein [Syntrophobacterales bacterium]